MGTVICDISALSEWRRASALGDLGPCSSIRHRNPVDIRDGALPARSGVVTAAPPSAAILAELPARLLSQDGGVHLLVGSQHKRRALAGATVHVCSEAIPSRSLCPLLDSANKTKGIYLTSPELTLLQLSNDHTLVEMLELIMELTGSYRLYNDSVAYGCPKLTSTGALRAFASKTKGLHGHKALARALKWAMDGSASPAETGLAIALALPWRLGGANLGIPLLNHTIELNDEAAAILGRRTITPDILLRKGDHRVAVEYDSREFHDIGEQVAYDERRRNAYAAMGIICIIVRPGDLRTNSSFSAIAAAIRKNLGMTCRAMPSNYAALQHRLLGEALAQWRRPHNQSGQTRDERLPPTDM